MSAGALKTFRSSDREGTEGIEYGTQWFREIMAALDQASDVVCLLTRRSVGRPWILFEAGVATAKADRPVFGVALGIALSRATPGPFAQFQNCDGSVEGVTELLLQLMTRMEGADPTQEAVQALVRAQVQAFLEKASQILEAIEEGEGVGEEGLPPDETSVARQFEEIKVMFQELPSRVESELEDSLRGTPTRRRIRFHPAMLEEIGMGGPEDDPAIGWLVLMALFRDEAPAVYETGMEVYRALRSGRRTRVAEAAKHFRKVMQFATHSRMGMEMMGEGGESHMLMELGVFSLHILDRMLERAEERPSENAAGPGQFPSPSGEPPPAPV